MATLFQKDTSSQYPIISLADRVRRLEEQKKFAEQSRETQDNTKGFNFPTKWRSAFRKSNRKLNDEKILVFFLNKKNEIENPKFMPIFDGNMIIWNNKPYEFDPRAVWSVKGMKGNPKAYLIKEIDRRPVRNKFGDIVYKDSAVSNMDLAEVRARGDSTESDVFLIKAALKAQTTQTKKEMNWIIIAVIAIIAIGGIIWFLTSK